MKPSDKNFNGAPDQRRLTFEISITAVVFLVLSWIGITADTTGDSGDSILHFLYSKYSFFHPEFFLHHWAKPVFVLLSAPFSQFGFKGIVVFNCLVASLTGLFTCWTARNLKLKNSWLVFIILFCSPLYFKLIFSGLTEYLFGLVLIISLYCATKRKFLTSVLIVSFLPFIRSEGLIILGVYGLFLLLIKQYKLIPWLLAGHLAYSVIGFFYYKDFLWVFTKIPYATLGSVYGKGELLDFVHRLNYVIEKPIYLLLSFGFIALFFRSIRFKTEKINFVELILVYGGFVSFFAAHSLFWWLGIFNSMGLSRVLIAVLPLAAIIALTGFDFVADLVRPPFLRYIIQSAAVLIILFYPFTYRERGIVFNKNLFVIPENQLIDEQLVPYLKQNVSGLNDRLVYYSLCYVSVALNIDHFNKNRHRDITASYEEPFPEGAIIIWDDWFSVAEGGVSFDNLKNNKNLKLLKVFERPDHKRSIKFALFISTADYPVKNQ